MTAYRTIILLGLGAAILAAQPKGQPILRTVASLNQYNQPAGIIEGSPGVFYSMTSGNVFSVTSKGAMTTLAVPPTGAQVISRVVSGPDGRYYTAVESSFDPQILSVTSSPGSAVTGPVQSIAPAMYQGVPDGTFLGGGQLDASGYVLGVSASGQVTPVYQFPSGERQYSNVVYANDGNYYGVSQQNPATTGYVYRVTPSGTLTQLYNFPAGSFAGYYGVAILQASDGNFYGTTPTGGPHGSGTIYKLTPSGQYTLLYAYASPRNGGPVALIEGSDGNLYGATLGTVGSGHSLLFRIGKSGAYSPVVELTTAYCYCTLVQGSDGIIYGTAQAGGASGAGEIFALDVGLPKPLPSPLKFGPQSGAPGTRVRIWGQNLLSASVAFNGVAAREVSNSGSNYVWATVPTGATSGPITVTTPGGSATTQSSFTVE